MKRLSPVGSVCLAYWLFCLLQLDQLVVDAAKEKRDMEQKHSTIQQKVRTHSKSGVIYLFCSLNFVQKCLQHLLTKITFNPQNTIISCTNVNEKHEWQVKASRLILRVTYVQIWTFGGNVSKHFEVEPCDRAVTLTSCPLQL